MKTKLGWVIQGTTTSMCAFTTVANCHSITEMWDLETIGIKDPAQTKMTEVVRKEIMGFFEDTVRVNDESRYEVRLLWREDVNLSNNKNVALKRLYSTTKRLLSTENFKEYDNCFKEWLQSGIIEQVVGDDDGHYLSHHAVIKEASLTTRVRPVFDASAKDNSGRSLNSSLEPGINLLELIPKLLVDFRMRMGLPPILRKLFYRSA